MTPALAQLHRTLGIPADYAAKRGWPEQTEPPQTDLASIGEDAFGREQFLTLAAARAWLAMQSAALKDGITLQTVSAFRSVAYQAEVIRRKLDSGRDIDAILEVNACPGYSEHHTGRALDLTTPDCAPLEEAFENTAAFDWLTQHANAFGFTLSYPRGNPLNMAYEPWHWAYRETR